MKKIIYILSVLIILGSCSEFLVQEPNEQRSVNEQFSNKELSLQAINGMYRSLESFISGKQFIYADLLGGNLSFSPAENDRVLEIPPAAGITNSFNFNDEAEDSDFGTVYETAYELINESNIIIERLEDAEFFTEEERKQIVAEALAVRTISHFILTQFYSQNFNYSPDGSHLGIVYNDRVLISGVDYPSRLSLAESYDRMKTDLEKALSFFSKTSILDKGPDYSYMNQTTTRALYARIALHMNDWETALEYSDLVINSSGKSLMDSSQLVAEWEKPLLPVSEIILEFTAPVESTDGNVTSSVGPSYYNYIDDKNYRDYVASQDLMDSYDSTDIRKNLFMEILIPTSINGIITDEPYFFTKKFQDDPGTSYIRLSEMYLIRAEAYARIGGNDNLALDDLNRIRTRAGLEEITETTDILEEIFLERRRELAFEGHLFFDIARFKKDVIRNNCIGTTCNLSYPSDYFILPIPTSSTELNNNMKQNEGY
jgi:hypothetical protein